MYTTRLLTTRLFTGTHLAHVLALGHLSADDGNDTRDARYYYNDAYINQKKKYIYIYIYKYKFKLDLEKLLSPSRTRIYLPTYTAATMRRCTKNVRIFLR